MKRIVPLVTVLWAVCCFAQESSPARDDSPPPASPYAAPAPGHPLDPADVAILTGKPSSEYGVPSTYAAPPLYVEGASRYYGDWASGPFIRSRSGFFGGTGLANPFFFSFNGHRRAPFFFGRGTPFLFGAGRPFLGFHRGR